MGLTVHFAGQKIGGAGGLNVVYIATVIEKQVTFL
jgi:hypothetical protein